MTTIYSHSIRHKLFIALGFDELEYAITDNNFNKLSSGKYATTDFEMFESVLTNTKELNEIYNGTTVIFCGSNALCHPSTFINTAERKKLYSASYRLKSSETICKGSISDDITISYSADSKILDLVKQKFPNLVYQHDLEVFVKYILKEIKPSGTSISLSNMGEYTLMVVSDAQKLLLMNQFYTKDLQDVFYFTMLAIEQLDLDIEKLTLNWIQNDDFGKWEDVNLLFKDYIRTVQNVQVPQTYHSALTMAIACE